MSRKTANPLTSHGIALVSHRTGSNLTLLKRFLNLLPASQQSDVSADLVSSGSETTQPGDDIRVQLPAVCLTSDNETAGEARLLGDEIIEILHFVMISIKQL